MRIGTRRTDGPHGRHDSTDVAGVSRHIDGYGVSRSGTASTAQATRMADPVRLCVARRAPLRDETVAMPGDDRPRDFFERKAGHGCPQCDEGRPAETRHGVRYSEGRSTDGYLQRVAPTLGYSVVVFRERHVGDLQSMSTDELARFWSEAASVARAIEITFRPVHLNLQVLGNADPHVHVHIVARYANDPAPCRPLPATCWQQAHTLTDQELTAQVTALRATIAADNSEP